MSKVYFSSDWHFGHRNIHKFRNKGKGFFRDFENEGEHCQWLIEEALSTIKKRDTLYLLGDIAFDEESLRIVGSLPGRKVLVKGNHDLKKSPFYSEVFDQIHGLTRYKYAWLSHSPIHPDELRSKINLHGHVHFESIPDKRYFNCCVENLVDIFDKPIVSYDDIIEYRRSVVNEVDS